jgi:hypothetical protein
VTLEQQNRFLDELAVSGNLVFACRAGGLSRDEALERRTTDRTFEALWREASRLADVLARSRMATRR